MTITADIPAHIAVVMDGNGRWAQKKNRPRTFGHQAGLKALRKVVEHCGRIGVRELTVFAFSSENWNRPEKEVSRLMDLFMRALDRETRELHENNVRVRFVGNLSAFTPELQKKIERAHALTAGNDRMTLNVAANYGGRWDIVQAARKIAEAVADGLIEPDQVDQELYAGKLALAGSSDPDLFIRTGGEMRISNFLLWQSAYTEFWFTPVLWPDFGPETLDAAISAYQSRERRFGLTAEQTRKISAPTIAQDPNHNRPDYPACDAGGGVPDPFLGVPAADRPAPDDGLLGIPAAGRSSRGSFLDITGRTTAYHHADAPVLAHGHARVPDPAADRLPHLDRDVQPAVSLPQQ